MLPTIRNAKFYFLFFILIERHQRIRAKTRYCTNEKSVSQIPVFALRCLVMRHQGRAEGAKGATAQGI